jgi:hypothetical protein
VEPIAASFCVMLVRSFLSCRVLYPCVSDLQRVPCPTVALPLSPVVVVSITVNTVRVRPFDSCVYSSDRHVAVDTDVIAETDSTPAAVEPDFDQDFPCTILASACVLSVNLFALRCDYIFHTYNYSDAPLRS